jgi:hypothetical protein
VVSHNPEDDIIDDYEEVKPDKDTRRIPSEASGRVPPPPNNGPRPKGKISQSQAKLIWIVCIAITVLGLGAVGVDLFLDPLGRRVPQPVVEQPQPPQQPRTRPQQQLTEHQLLARQFAHKANEFRQEVVRSDIHEATFQKIQDARDALGAAQNDRAENELWARTWREYYQAAYLFELFKHLYPFDDLDVPLVSNLQDVASMEAMTEAELNSVVSQRALGYYLPTEALRGQLESIRRSLRELSVAQNVRNNEQFKEELSALEQRFHNARDNGEFDPADLDQYGPGAQPLPAETDTETNGEADTETNGETNGDAAGE